MLKAKEGEFFNPGFNSVEFDIIKKFGRPQQFPSERQGMGWFSTGVYATG